MSPGLQLPAWGTSKQPSACLLKIMVVTFGWDSVFNLPTMIYMWSICLACFSLWIWFILLFPNTQSSQPRTWSSWLSFCLSSNRVFPSNQHSWLNPDCCSLLEFTFLEMSQRIRLNGDAQAKASPKTESGRADKYLDTCKIQTMTEAKCEVGIKSQRMVEGLRDLGRINYIFRTMGSWEGYEDARGRSWECGSSLTLFLSAVWSYMDNLDPFKFLQTQWTPIVSTWVAPWIYDFDSPQKVNIIQPKALTTHALLRPFRMDI